MLCIPFSFRAFRTEATNCESELITPLLPFIGTGAVETGTGGGNSEPFLQSCL